VIKSDLAGGQLPSGPFMLTPRVGLTIWLQLNAAMKRLRAGQRVATKDAAMRFT
jgi:hypothetical protein